MRQLSVAIAGGGVGGLTTALGLLKAGYDVTLYEKTGKFARFGGPIQFASNALSTLKAVDERLFERVMEKFTFTGTRRCGLKDGLRADGKFSMTPVADPRYVFDESVPADWYLEFPLKQCADFFKLPYTGVINRPDLQEILLDECRALKPDFLINGAAVTSYSQPSGGGPVEVTLGTGETVTADVLIGSDGIWSAVRAQRLGGCDPPPRYMGVVVVLGRAPCAHPLAQQQIFQTLDGDTRIYAMPFTAPAAEGEAEAAERAEVAAAAAEGVTMWQLSFKMSEAAAVAMARDGASLKAEALRRCGGWHAPIPQLLAATAPPQVEGGCRPCRRRRALRPAGSSGPASAPPRRASAVRTPRKPRGGRRERTRPCGHLRLPGAGGHHWVPRLRP